MADTVTSQTIHDGPKHYAIRLTNISDGTGETTPVQKVNKSALVGLTGAEPTKLVLMRAEFSIQGFEAVKIAFDHATDQTVLVLAGDDYRDFSRAGGMPDPGSGGTGDVLLTTIGTAAANDTYDITLYFEKKG